MTRATAISTRIFRHYAPIVILLFGSAIASHAERAGTPISIQSLNNNVHMLVGQGGNIAASVGSDGTLIVDDQFDHQLPHIEEALNELDSADAPRLIINTHFHGDHTGANAALGSTGIIVAHSNVRVRLVSGDAQDSALPVVTFDDRLRVHFNGDVIDVIHTPEGHTDGDAMVFFRNANIAHLGDHLFVGSFPYIDLRNGGSLKGFIQNLEFAQTQINDETQIIPGHGVLASLSDLAATITMLKASRSFVQDGIDQSLTAEALIEKGLGPEYESWGKGFINEARWLQTVFDDLTTRVP